VSPLRRCAGAAELNRMDESERRFQQLRAAWATASRAVAPRSEPSYRMCDESVRMRIAGTRLAANLEPPFEHLRVSEPRGEPRLTIEIWDASETGVSGVPPAESSAAGRSWEGLGGLFAVSADGSIVSHQQPGSVIWLDRRGGTMVGWFADARRMSIYEKG